MIKDKPGTVGLLFVVTGIHGAHVIVGCLAISFYMLNTMHWALYSYATCTTTQLLVGVVGYWHLVDGIWIAVVLCVYWAVIALHLHVFTRVRTFLRKFLKVSFETFPQKLFTTFCEWL